MVVSFPDRHYLPASTASRILSSLAAKAFVHSPMTAAPAIKAQLAAWLPVRYQMAPKPVIAAMQTMLISALFIDTSQFRTIDTQIIRNLYQDLRHSVRAAQS